MLQHRGHQGAAQLDQVGLVVDVRPRMGSRPRVAARAPRPTPRAGSPGRAGRRRAGRRAYGR
ncbi:hypothetical protein IEQ44_00655 [Nocardioides sp. Y6]|uniref:Uncharacterized protein n=1 Tax=Nocardioides malaquae TaxID=2773426 RepID=A0ABR9RPQ7_9ACTN|nr:hypothetical protein [Nocardioides malaquae]MBE7323160.1 hypothetical protein [Nocardioides malaquae]